MIGALLGVVGMVTAACAQESGLKDSFDKSQYNELLEHKLRVEVAAPVVLVGRVTKVGYIGPPRPSPGDVRMNTQLTRITIDVETVIKGSVPTNLVTFYYFIFAKENATDLGRPRYIPEGGQRRIFFLKPENGLLRSVGDVTDYTLGLRSGRHARDYCQGENAGGCIGMMLLTPGESDFENDAFARDLYQSAYVTGVLCSRTAARTLLERLMQSRDSKIAASARATVVMMRGEARGTA